MNANQVKTLVSKVPAIRRSVDLKSFNVSWSKVSTQGLLLILRFDLIDYLIQASKAGDIRLAFAGLVLLPLVVGADVNGGVAKLGFSTGTTMESEFKMKPDYATGTVFAAERRDVPTFKQM